jgi:hypothetical protein
MKRFVLDGNVVAMTEVEVMKKGTEFRYILNTLPQAETHCNILEVCTLM